MTPPGGSAPAPWLDGRVPGRALGRPLLSPGGPGPLNFGGEEDALSPAVRGGDGLQLQEVQQHLDLPGGAGGDGGSEKGRHPDPGRTQGPAGDNGALTAEAWGPPPPDRSWEPQPRAEGGAAARLVAPSVPRPRPPPLHGSVGTPGRTRGCGTQAVATGPGQVGKPTVPGT